MGFETTSGFEDFTEFEDMKIIWDSQNEEKLVQQDLMWLTASNEFDAC